MRKSAWRLERSCNVANRGAQRAGGAQYARECNGCIVVDQVEIQRLWSKEKRGKVEMEL